MRSAYFFAVLIFGACVSATGPALAQQNSREVSLVRQDFSDCSNADVKDQDAARVGGTASVARGSDGTTRVSVRLTGRPNTTYHFFLKCVRLLGDITTQGDGSAAANFDFQTIAAGDIFAFDMYPEGAPLGDKFQSVQVNFRDPPPPPPPPPPPVEVSPRVLYLSQSATGISIAYADMPAATEIVLANGTSGDETTSRIAIREGAAESIDFPIDPNQSPGLYYLLARNQTDKRYIAQTVAFYIN